MKVKERNFPAGRVIFAEGDPALEAYLIKQGRVEIVRRHRGKRQVLQNLEAGAIFGEMSLINDSARSADAVVAENCICLVIDHTELQRQLTETPRFVRGLVRILSDRLKTMNDRSRD